MKRKKVLYLIIVSLLVLLLNGCSGIMKNHGESLGNTDGNLQQRGLVASDGKWIYYEFKGGLYKSKLDGSEKTMLYSIGEEKPNLYQYLWYINVRGDWVYFSGKNNETGTAGLYKIKKDGTGIQRLVSDTYANEVYVIGDKIYYDILLGIFVKGTPEEAGCYPDNDPEIAAIIKAEEEGVKEMEKVSYVGALKNKYVWIFGLGAGCFGLATVGIMSQLVSYFMAARGYELTGALSMLTIAAVIGMIGSWAWGVVDQKLGTQKACLMFGIWYFIGIAFLIAPPTPCMYIGLFMLGGAIGGNGNFLPSLAAQVFGRKDFNVSYACMNMINGIVRSCSFFVLAVLRSMTSGYTVPYMVFAVIAVIGGVLIVAVKEKKAIQ